MSHTKGSKVISVLIALVLLFQCAPTAALAAAAETAPAAYAAGNDITWELSGDGILRIHGKGVMPDYDADGNTPPWFQNSTRKNVKMVVVDKGITSIGAYAFSVCPNLICVRLPEGVTKIGEAAFMGCSGLEQIAIPNSVTEIGKAAFYNCSSLLMIFLPLSLQRIGLIALSGCAEEAMAVYPGTQEQFNGIDTGKNELEVKFVKGEPTQYTVTFNTQEGTAIPADKALEYGYAVKPANPSKKDVMFGGWFLEPECTHAFDFFATPIEKDTTLYAKWTKGERIDVSARLGTLLPAELNEHTVRELLGEENYAACVARYGSDASVQVGSDELALYDPVKGGLSGKPELSDLFYVMCEDLWRDRLSFEADLYVGKSASALDSERTHFILSFDVYFMDEVLDLSLAVQQPDGERQVIGDFFRYDTWSAEETSVGVLIYNNMTADVSSEAFTRNSTAWAGLSFQEGFDSSGVKVSIYEGWSNKPLEYKKHPEMELTSQIWNQNNLASRGGYALENQDGTGTVSWFAMGSIFTILLERDGVTQVIPTIISLFPKHKFFTAELYASSGLRKVGSFRDQEVTDGIQVKGLELPASSDYTANSDFWLRLTYFHNAEYGGKQGIDFVRAAYEGSFQSEEEARKAGAVNIKDQLFTEAGYRRNFTGGVTFTIVDTDGEVFHYRYVVTGAVDSGETETPVPGESDTYFDPWGVAYATQAGQRYMTDDSTLYRWASDTYYYNGYHTVFLVDQEGNGLKSGTEVSPLFVKGNSVSIYAGQHTLNGRISSGVRQTSGESKITLSGPVTTVQYSAASENRVCLKNYWVSYVTKYTGGGKLYVNGVTNAIAAHKNEQGEARRVVVLDKTHAYTHDVFVANIGDEPLPVKVTLTEAKGVELDSYWTGNGTLDPFTSSEDSDSNGLPGNSTKITLRAQWLEREKKYYEGEISGKLTITAGNGEEAVIRLSGYANSFSFTTEAMGDAVRYVPYDQAIQNSSSGPATAVTYRPVGGSLPNGLSLYRNGVIYGIPTNAGRYTFTVAAQLSGVSTGLPDECVEREFTINVLDNTDQNVWKKTDTSSNPRDDYSITIAIPNQNGSSGNINLGGRKTATTEGNDWDNRTMLLRSKGSYSLFRGVYLDGRKLVEGKEYISEEGSTKITLLSQVIRESGEGQHTLAAEFYENQGYDGTLRRAAQNYTVTKSVDNNQPGKQPDDVPESEIGTGQGQWWPMYGVSVSGEEHGKVLITPSAQVWTDSAVCVVVTPDEGWSTSALKVTGETGSPVETKYLGSGMFSFTMPGQNVSVTPEFTQGAGQSSWELFTDVKSGDWFFDSVLWAYKDGCMNGVGGGRFAPQGHINQAMVATVLARMSGVNLTSFSGLSYDGIAPGQYYSNAAIWATQAGILPDRTDFSNAETITRGNTAIMLLKYLRGIGVKAEMPAAPAKFSDEDMMTDDEYEAFQILCALGIFNGVGSGRMNPDGVTSRAQLAALLQRLDAVQAQ